MFSFDLYGLYFYKMGLFSFVRKNMKEDCIFCFIFKKKKFVK